MSLEEFIVPVPRDVEMDLLDALEAFGIHAATTVATGAEPGVVRVSRVGGDLQAHEQRDRPRMLIEVWGADGPDAYELATAVWAACAVIRHRQVIVPGVAATDVALDPPRSQDDPLAPGLKRVQFQMEYLTPLTEYTITEVGNNG